MISVNTVFRFHVEFELPKVRFCSNPIYTAVVQYGHLSDENDLTFKLKVTTFKSLSMNPTIVGRIR